MTIQGTKAFVSEVLTSADVNQYLMRGVKVFGGTAARDSAYGGAGEPLLEEGEAIFLTDTDRLQIYGGTAIGWLSYPTTTQSGKILQIVSTTLTTIVSLSQASGAITDVTGLNVSITPSATSSKVLILATVNGMYDVGANRFGLSVALKRGSTVIGGGTTAGSRTSISSSTMAPGLGDNQASANPSIMYLDSPNTTSATTYTVAVHNPYNATFTTHVNRIGADSDVDDIGRTSSTIIVMEVSA